jgi:hypothetical protein
MGNRAGDPRSKLVQERQRLRIAKDGLGRECGGRWVNGGRTVLPEILSIGGEERS